MKILPSTNLNQTHERPTLTVPSKMRCTLPPQHSHVAKQFRDGESSKSSCDLWRVQASFSMAFRFNN
ncbi:hypothetical protein CEE69_01980 [Rhodopirellula bahusiensis]|uniref:Uncharacterized protein n=1 Tax=Rhodopirellula bahusiensis TaxID=2014065 RepID=A0A2G1WDQ6_9BACT|nr:hypothetical protein CEE69_01980 [Rhodopirellula bahusiensis]